MSNSTGSPDAKGYYKDYGNLDPYMMFQLAGPQTWAAAICPALVSFIYCATSHAQHLNLVNTLFLLCICILMQSAVNVFDDYFDYKKGTDTLENSSSDAFDAVLLYNNLNPKSVLVLAIVYLAIAGILGFYLVYITGWKLLIIGLIGAAATIAYSGGKTPISHLPIGEITSGIVMGGLIPLACCYVLSGQLDAFSIVIALPCILGVGMILLTNNSCDIEKDSDAGRKTVTVLLGRKKTVFFYHGCVYAWLAVLVLLDALFFTKALLFALIMLLASFPILRALLQNPLQQPSRDAAMSQITMLNIILSVFYSLSIMSDSLITWI